MPSFSPLRRHDIVFRLFSSSYAAGAALYRYVAAAMASMMLSLLRQRYEYFISLFLFYAAHIAAALFFFLMPLLHYAADAA